MYQPTDVVTEEETVRTHVRGAYASQQNKILNHLDEHCKAWIERSPFLTLATVSASGQVDVSPKGDPAGFCKVLDDKSLAIPDRPGNHRYDSFLNILDTGRIGLCFFVPNRNEVVRVNGSAQIVRDMSLREMMVVQGRVPDFALLVRVEEAFYHCGKAIIRSKLWKPEKAASIEGLPTYATAIKDQAEDQRSIEEIEKMMKYNDEKRLYDE
ncbi:MAG: MSMEG_1061 family FMN-dependent PPOX-type flavoprotein [Pseudomonadota bacterium]